MLKTLRVTSLVSVILAAIGVITIVVLGLKGDPQAKDFLAQPGFVEELRKKAGQEDVKDEKSSPLVEMARLIALRFDPPPPPKPVVKDVPKPPAETARAKPVPKAIPTPKVQTSIKSDLLATVLYKSAPEKSLALLKTTGNKQEWFRQGEKVGHLEIKEVRDGSVIFTQGGRNPQEKFVPAKPQVKSLLKSDKTTSTAPRPGTDSVTTQVAASDLPGTAGTEATPTAKSPTAKTTDSGKISMVRSSRPDVSKRIQRVRSTPPPASPQERKKSLNKTMSNVEDAMKRRDESASEEDRKKEDEMWMRLLKELNTEKERLDTMTEAEELSEEGAEETEPTKQKK